MTQVAILWHMHQPYYEDLATGEHILPWVRLHALKDYYGMVALLREFPTVKVTFNLVPSLLVQLEAFASGRARDRYLELSLKPATELTASDIDFMLENFFHAQRERMIDAYPRYGELLGRRGASSGGGADADSRARRFSVDDLRDLQVWQKLAWIDPEYQRHDARVRDLIAKGQHFSEEDKSLLRTVELELLNAVIPEYRDAAARGRVELSASPYYHPILPLLCDTDVYLRTHPASPMPRRRFAHPEDAALQLARAVACHERLFGRPPAGLWPSEGSVSDAMVPLVAAAGFKWMATDELILSRTLGVTFSRDASGHVEQPERLYAPYTVQAGGATVACVFRDHVLSDLIGFTYARWPAEDAAADFVGRIVEAGRRYRAAGGGEALVPIILDGENAWEHFDGGGRPFLRALYRRLSEHPELQTVTMAEASAGTHRHEIGSIFPGSWIDANFYIWMGHPDDQRAWSQLADARHALDETAADAARRDAAREELLIAEGSDWCWWYGEDHSSAQDREFDELFRRHLRHVYRLLEKPVPDELFVSNISAPTARSAQSAPTRLLTPTLDGEETSYFEWLGAGTLEARETGGTMHRIDQPPTVLELVRFAFGLNRLYLRLDAARPVVALLTEGYVFTLTFLDPPGIRFSVAFTSGELVGRLSRPEAKTPSIPGADAPQLAAGTVLEIGIPTAVLSVNAGDRVAFFVGVSRDSEADVERHPADGVIEMRVPAPGFPASLWTT